MIVETESHQKCPPNDGKNKPAKPSNENPKKRRKRERKKIHLELIGFQWGGYVWQDRCRRLLLQISVNLNGELDRMLLVMNKIYKRKWKRTHNPWYVRLARSRGHIYRVVVSIRFHTAVLPLTLPIKVICHWKFQTRKVVPWPMTHSRQTAVDIICTHMY